MAQNNSILKNITRKLTLQVCLIAITAALAITLSSLVLEHMVVREALENEAKHFWLELEKDENFVTPNTDNLLGYLTSDTAPRPTDYALPEEFKDFGGGHHDLDGRFGRYLLYVTNKDHFTLYLLFDSMSVMRLALFFGILPLTVILILIYIAGWLVYRQSNQLLSPIVWLSKKFDKFDPAHPDATLVDISEMPGNVDWEIEKLANSISDYSQRIQQLVEREQTFTRDASHEFRTPLTVIKMATSMLMDDPDLGEPTTRKLKRIEESVLNMEGLIDAFLMLARETENDVLTEPVDISTIVKQQICDAEVLLKDKPVKVIVTKQGETVVYNSEKVLSIIVGNLLRNAILYTNEGTVSVTMQANGFQIKDTGIGMSAAQIERIYQPHYRGNQSNDNPRKGYGVGLTIVKRLVERLRWQLTIESELGKGTTATIKFS